ncbi:MAG: hypothetical protein CL561_09860 [Alphaproteobacteria bacterium]|nr:hypothetical protein [Alphaproteobacteria bacterium]|tara:strand:- start:12819 stop:16313 length:3495 start_codon:yes stop_codon:yes gene_type:complete
MKTNDICHSARDRDKAKGSLKTPVCTFILTALLLNTSCLTSEASAQNLPYGADIAQGSSTLDYTQENALHITQHTQKTVINWESFNIGEGQLTAFHQPNERAVALNRVVGNNIDPTQILGRLEANGQIIVLDSNGVFFGPNAQIDVGGLLASTGDINDQSFMQNSTINITNANTDGEIVNHGNINIKDAGIASFVSPTVVNNGYITAKLGNVVLASGAEATVDLYGDGLLEITLDKGQSQDIINTGLISASGGYVHMEAAAAADIVDNLIVNTGVITANSVSVDKQGVIKLYAQGSQTAAPSAKGISTTLNAGIIHATGYKDGAHGGNIDILGDHVALTGSSLIDASGHSGGGDIKVGGAYMGKGTTPTARYSYIDESAVILNDAIHTGNGGSTIIWSDDQTDFFGRVFSRGGANSGDGGFVETSGKNILNAYGFVDLTAEHGNKGTYLLDPENITIYGGQASAIASNDLISHWDFEEGSGTSAIDDISGYNGTITGATYSTETADSILSGQYSLAFDGSNDHVDFIDISEIENSDFTISFWARSNTLSKDQGFLYKGNHGMSQPLLIWRDDSAGGFANIGKGNSNALSALLYDGKRNYGLSSKTNTLNDTEWHHIAVSVDLTNSVMELYVDGNAQVNGLGNINNNGILNNNNIVRIGESLNGSRDLNGNIDELRIYSAALSSDQISELSGNRFTVEGLEALSQTADIVLQATDTITLDLQGDTLGLADGRSLSLQTTNGNITDISNGKIQTKRIGLSGGDVTINAGGTGSIALNSTDFDLQSGGTLTLSAGGNISVTSTNNLNLAKVSGENIFLQTTNGSADITLNDTVTSRANGNSIVIASGNNFFNNYGANALDSGDGRWLVYSSDPAQNSSLGLTGDFKRYNQDFINNSPADISENGNGFLYSIAPSITFEGKSITREYGEENPAFTSSYSGLIDGDTATSAFVGKIAYSAADATADAGTSPIKQSIGTLTSPLGYQFTFVDGNLTIEKAPLEIIANDTKREALQQNPQFTATYSGFKLTDTLDSMDTLAQFKTLAETNSKAGAYTITPYGAASKNYNFIYTDGTLSINPIAAEDNIIPPTVTATLSQNIQQPKSAGRTQDLPVSDIAVNDIETGAGNNNNDSAENKDKSTSTAEQQESNFSNITSCLASYKGSAECILP